VRNFLDGVWLGAPLHPAGSPPTVRSRSARSPMFLGLGVGSEIVALLALLSFFRRRGWF
jgi:hypothetical protein